MPVSVCCMESCFSWKNSSGCWDFNVEDGISCYLFWNIVCLIKLYGLLKIFPSTAIIMLEEWSQTDIYFMFQKTLTNECTGKFLIVSFMTHMSPRTSFHMMEISAKFALSFLLDMKTAFCVYQPMEQISCVFRKMF